jgi:hypothetical protein
MEYIGGAGLKIFPRELINLYHCVLNERFYHTGGGARSYPLPQSHLPYAEEDDWLLA